VITFKLTQKYKAALIWHTNCCAVYPDFYIFSKGLPVSQGYPLPGTNWKNISYQFYIDENGNSQLDTGETSKSYSITGSIVKLGLVQNVKIFGDTHPTIEWDAVPSADQYHVRLFSVVDGNPSTDSFFFDVVKSEDGSGTYSFTYNGDLFSQYETLAIGIEARDYQDGKLVNRSRYIVKYLPLQRKGNSMPGIPLLLLDN
jgi:hypothetical protein